ncbi:MAG: hypothetical protein ACI81R_003741 [Bradymonadia bacterium]
MLHNDFDDEFETLTAMLVDDVTSGTLLFEDDGSFVFTPGFDGPTVVTFT